MKTDLRRWDALPPAAVACYAVAASEAVPFASNAAAVILCFVLTGLSIAGAVCASGAGFPARAWTATAASLGSGILGGLALDRFPSGLTRPGWTAYALLVVSAAYVVGLARRSSGDRPRPAVRLEVPSARTCMTLLASAALLLTSIAVPLTVDERSGPPFTELWLVPNGPNRTPSGATSAIVGIRSHQTWSEDFRVVVDTGQRLLVGRVTLAPGDVWTQQVAIEGVKATASVYRAEDSAQPYRVVWVVP